MKNEFEYYLKQSRKRFVKITSEYDVKEHLELRKAAAIFLIAYDQAMDKALKMNKIQQQEIKEQ